MGVFNDTQLLGLLEHDTVTSTLQEPDTAYGGAGTVAPLTSVCLLVGPRPFFITDLQVYFSDIAITDPGGDRHLGWSIQSAAAGTTTPSYTALEGKTANGDLPLINDNSVSTTAVQAVVNVPVNLFNYVGQTRASPDVMYATQAAMPGTKKQDPIRVAANALLQVRLGTYLAGSLAAIADMSDVVVAVYGKYV